MRISTIRVGTGSSPLARGLLDNLASSLSSGRIIPARAGFTRGALSPSYQVADHPRSRGVYSGWRPGIVGSIGSSPLARGLPGDDLHVRQGRRIIPARAGFTIISLLRNCVSSDHPRSRGVYFSDDFNGLKAFGSSPLARGLRMSGRVHRATLRIIPARAGFTFRGIFFRESRRDHPRSRGVYGGVNLRTLETDGSSPLARGLHQNAGTGAVSSRIIPARAGFTSSRDCATRRRRDHPRSRGVY